MKRHPGRPRATASPWQCALTTLLLTFLTLIGGATTASGAGYALPTRSLGSAAITAPGPVAPRARPAGHPERESGHRAGQDAAAHEDRATAGSGPGPAPRTGREHAGHEQPRAAGDPARAPRAGTGRVYLFLHAPPLPHDALPALPARPAGTLRPARVVAADSFDTPGGRRGELPGVRGPPGGTTGSPTGPFPRSVDPVSRPR